MSNLYGIVPELLTWIIIDEVDLDLTCRVCVWCTKNGACAPASGIHNGGDTPKDHLQTSDAI